MPINLTGSTPADTYDQLLHVDDGPTATEKTVYGGAGVATALKVGTGSASVDNLRLDGNTLSALDTNGNINLTPNGSGSVVATRMQLTNDLPISEGGTGASTAAAARANLGVLEPQWGWFLVLQDVSPAANTIETLSFNAGYSNTGVNFSGGTPTRMLFTTAGVYFITIEAQFVNSDTVDHDATMWLRLNGTTVPQGFVAKTTVPKASDGGHAILQLTGGFLIGSNQYGEVQFVVENGAVDMDYIPAVTGPPAISEIPACRVTVTRIAP